MRPCSSYYRDNKGAYATIAISSQSKEFAFFLNFKSALRVSFTLLTVSIDGLIFLYIKLLILSLFQAFRSCEQFLRLKKC